MVIRLHAWILVAFAVPGAIRADNPSFMPAKADHLIIQSLSKIEARDTEEAKQGLPRRKVARDSQVFHFHRKDGTRITAIDGKRTAEHGRDSAMAATLWSTDDGQTWTWREGPSDDAAFYGPATAGEKAAIQLRGSGEILSISATSLPMKRNVPGNEGFFEKHPNFIGATQRYYLNQRRSVDGWQQASRECGLLDTPNAVPIHGDNGRSSPGFILQHGLIELPNGDLLATLYGNNEGDQTDAYRADGYPPSFNMYKCRVIVVRSSDGGRTWGSEREVAHRWMSARDEGDSASTAGNIKVPAITQEGFNEADLALAPNGDIVCLMRSGGRISTPSAPVYSTPLYMARSADGGETWSAPRQVAPFGVNPDLATLGNGIMVATYARPGGWIMFSTDNGMTWKGHRQVTTSDSYTALLVTGPNEFVVYYHQSGAVWGEEFRVDLKPVK